MSSAFSFSRWRLQEVGKRRERKRSALECGCDGFQIDEGAAPIAGRDLPLPLSARIPPLRWMGELDQRGATIEVADLNCRPPPKRRELEREAATHGLAASRAMLDRQTRDIERQIEADNRSAKIIGSGEQHFVHEFRRGSQLVSALARDALKQIQFLVADGGRIIEEPGFVQFVAFAKLISADAQSLRRIDSCFGVEGEGPFGWRRGLARSLFVRGSSPGFGGGGAKARTYRQAIGLDFGRDDLGGDVVMAAPPHSGLAIGSPRRRVSARIREGASPTARTCRPSPEGNALCVPGRSADRCWPADDPFAGRSRCDGSCDIRGPSHSSSKSRPAT